MTTQVLTKMPTLNLPPGLAAGTPDAPPIARLFVYGTLRQGRGNHRLLDGARFLGVRHTQPAFTMVNLGSFPGVLAGGQTSIVGEVYEVTDPGMLAKIDRLEGHPQWYVRTPIRTIEGDDVEIYIYPSNEIHGFRQTIVESGDWTAR